MTDYLKILRLDYLDYSQRRIADSARCSRHTIRKVLEVARPISTGPLTRTLPPEILSRYTIPLPESGAAPICLQRYSHAAAMSMQKPATT